MSRPGVSRRPARRRPTGQCYLIHFDEKYEHAQHYVGYTERLTERMIEHQTGRGSPLVAAVVNAGIGLTLARVWPNATRALERSLHRRKNSPRHPCPICRAARNGSPTFADLLTGDVEVGPILADDVEGAT